MLGVRWRRVGDRVEGGRLRNSRCLRIEVCFERVGGIAECELRDAERAVRSVRCCVRCRVERVEKWSSSDVRVEVAASWLRPG